MAKSTKFLEKLSEETVTMEYDMRRKILVFSLLLPLLLDCLLNAKISFAQTNPLCLITLSDISLVYRQDRNEYDGTITIGNDFFCVASMVIRLEGKDGLQISELMYNVSGDQVGFQLDGSKLKAGQTYIVSAIPLNDAGEIFTTEDEQILRPKEFVHNPKGPDPLAVKIISVSPDHANGKLLIDVDVNLEDKVTSYEGFITDMETGGSIHTIEKSLFKSLRIEESLPDSNIIRTSAEAREYRLTLCFDTKDDNQVCADPYEFKPGPAPQKSTMQKIMGALNNPMISATVLIVLMSAIGFVIIRNSRASGAEPKLRRPPIGGTDTIRKSDRAESGTAGGRRSRQEGTLYVQIVRAPGSVNLKKQRISRFPYTIGREGCSLNINDPHISKPHIEISARDGLFYFKDMNSTNHTYVDEREISPNKLVQIRDVMVVRLGPNTEVEFEPGD